MATTQNAINADSTGLVRYNGTGTFDAVTTTIHDVLIGAANNGITNVAPAATSGIPLISQGAASDPAFGTAVVAGGGTGDTSFTIYTPVCGGTTTTGPLQSVVSTGTSGQVLTSNGPAALPTFQNSSASTGIAWTLIASHTWVNELSFSFTTGLTSYNELMVRNNNVGIGVSVAFRIAFSNNGGASYLLSGNFPGSASPPYAVGGVGATHNGWAFIENNNQNYVRQVYGNENGGLWGGVLYATTQLNAIYIDWGGNPASSGSTTLWGR